MYQDFVSRRISSKAEFREFIHNAEKELPAKTPGNIPYKSVLVANATLLLISAATYFLKRQIDGKTRKFLNNGGFAERMNRMRRENR